jgi:hypothetical protein
MESQSRFGWNCRAGGGEGERPLEEVFRCSGVQVFRISKDGLAFDPVGPEHLNT